MRDEAWADHTLALGLMYDAMDELQLHATQWNYTASNRNAARIGDGWNQEDLSIWSQDQQGNRADLDAGGRGLDGFCRPFAQAIQGRLGRMGFDRDSRRFRLDYDADPAISGPTVIYAPRRQYPTGVVVRIEGLPADLKIDAEGQRIEVTARAAGPLQVLVDAAVERGA